jgi:hypothetical protein
VIAGAAAGSSGARPHVNLGIEPQKAGADQNRAWGALVVLDLLPLPLAAELRIRPEADLSEIFPD